MISEHNKLEGQYGRLAVKKERKFMSLKEKCLELTKKLVAIPSVNATEGEREIGEFLYDYISAIPYFKKHPDQVKKVELKDDPLHRYNVYGLLIGEKSGCPDTILLHGHIDTVTTDDFGSLQKYAYDCDKLQEELLKIRDTLAEDVRADLESGDYLFGRGAGDMKGGSAVHVVLLEELSAHPELLDGNILVSLNPVEESLHKGFIDGIDTLLYFREQYRLNYLFAINNDFITSAYPGDETRYAYTGSVGKLLPCIYIRGKETHVGQAFEGYDACRVAGEIVKRVNLNCDLMDGYDGEYPAPPVALRMMDLKPCYSVQTPLSSFVYFNYMVHNRQITEVLSDFKKIAGEAMQTVSDEMNEHYKEYCAKIGVPFVPLRHKLAVLEYRELYQTAREIYEKEGRRLDKLIDSLAEQSAAGGDDKRITSLRIVERLTDLAGIKNPTAVVFFATPHCPHNTLKKDVAEEKELTEQIDAILQEFGAKYNESMKLMHFFPSLTDSSYLKIDDDERSIRDLQDNFPKQELLYPVPYEQIRELNIPGINYGTFGRDAHKWTERVKISYSFEKLPELIKMTIEKFLVKNS